MNVEIVFEDDALLAVNKPAGLLVHRSKIAAAEDNFLIDRLRTPERRDLFLIHRLDRATSGVVLLAKSRDVAAELGRQFMDRSVSKRYLAVVRGWPEAEGTIDYPLPDVRDNSPRKAAVTSWRTLATTRVPIPMGRYAEQRYALVEASPHTGRYRQIRKHFHHLSHHVVGDTSHGRGDHNRLWRIHFAMHRMLLHAWKIEFRHPHGEAMSLCAALDDTWRAVIDRFGWQPSLLDSALSDQALIESPQIPG